jgi:antitoxin component YwqK of YwqJK toxin-antitoxin module
MKSQLKMSFAILILLFCSCSNKTQEKPDEKILLNYKNGKKYCEGVHRVYEEENKIRKSRKGIWKFYYTNGNPQSIYEYDKEGNEKNYKEYYENGNIQKSEVNNNHIIVYSRFYENGNIELEITTETITMNIEGTVIKPVVETIREYYLNGQLKSHKKTINYELHGKARQWDIDGNLQIEYEYDHGIILKQKTEL